MIDIDFDQGIMVITFSGKKDRLFIFPIKTSKPEIKKTRGKIIIKFINIKDKLFSSPILYAHREWLKYQDNEYPFTIEPSSRTISELTIRYDGDNFDYFYNNIYNFFNLDYWKFSD